MKHSDGELKLGTGTVDNGPTATGFRDNDLRDPTEEITERLPDQRLTIFAADFGV